MTPRKFMRQKMRSAFAELKGKYKEYVHQVCEVKFIEHVRVTNGVIPQTWRQWLRLDT